MKRVLAIILGGGAGTRLYPLTKMRAKPAVPLAGKYRLIDIPVSNCINSGINKIYVLTQFNSASLNRHIAQTFNLSSGFDQGFVEVLAAQQTPDSPSWFEGTADAVRKYEWLLQEWDIDEVLILSATSSTAWTTPISWRSTALVALISPWQLSRLIASKPRALV